jgi:pilus assembly protein CpaF
MELATRLSGGEPSLPHWTDPFSDVKDRVHKAVIGGLGPRLFNTDTDPATLRARVVEDVAQELEGEAGIARTDRERLVRELTDDILGHGPLERLLADDTITEIMVNGPYEVWIERQGKIFHTDVRFTDDSHLRRIIVKMVAQAGRRVDESTPMVDARLADGSRINAVLPPLSLSGPLLTIRKFAKRRLGATELSRLGTLSNETVDFLDRCVRARLNILISGGTGTGKTTLLNVMSASIPEEDRVVTIEETAELQLHQKHVLRLESRTRNAEGEGEISIRQLVRNSLRMRPDRIIVGEVRGAEALDMLQAMNTGHDGSLCTLHANTPRDALARAETMVLMAGYDLPVRAIRQQVCSALDLIVHIARLRDGSRRVVAISEVMRMEADVITLQEIFTFNQKEITGDGKVVGRLEPTGMRPSFLDKFERYGVELHTGMFAAKPEPVEHVAEVPRRARAAGGRR